LPIADCGLKSTHRVRRRGLPATLIPVVLCLAAVGVVAAGQKADTGQSQPTPYAELVERYRNGDLAGAIVGLAEYDEPGVIALRELWFAGAGPVVRTRVEAVPLPELLLAAMLHTDCAFALLADERPDRAKVADQHLELADKLLTFYDLQAQEQGASPATATSFHIRWYLAVAMFMHRSTVSLGDKWLERGLARFPYDSALLLEAGVGQEQRGLFPPFSRQMSEAPAQTLRRRALLEAQGYCERALESAPDLVEAKLRLARLRSDLDPRHETLAVAELRQVLGAGPDVELGYLANLFLAAAHERAGHLDAAEASLRAAIALVPDAQSARTALAHILYRQGDREGAVAASRDALACDCSEIECDPWWRYPRSQFRSFDELLVGLRTEARR